MSAWSHTHHSQLAGRPLACAVLVVLLLTGIRAITGCEGGRVPLVCAAEGDVSVATQPLRGGAVEETFLALQPEQQAAVAAVYADAGFDAAPICTAVLVSLEHALTARHCVDDALRQATHLSLRFGPDGSAPQYVAEVGEIERHPELDLALIVLAHALPDDGSVASIAVHTRPFDSAMVGRHVAVAGYGLGDTLVAGSRAYAVATVDALDASSLRVSGIGTSGLCLGDSGGPLLARGDDGAVQVWGLLAEGSAACDGQDRFTRLDRAGEWLDAFVGEAASIGSTRCDSLGNAGRCFGARAIRCTGGALAVEDCGASQACGWDASRGAFACVAPTHDGCEGTAELGRCTGARAESCEAGVLAIEDCGACGMRCELSGRNGRAHCVDWANTPLANQEMDR